MPQVTTYGASTKGPQSRKGGSLHTWESMSWERLPHTSMLAVTTLIPREQGIKLGRSKEYFPP
jgi:hypothetical protein